MRFAFQLLVATLATGSPLGQLVTKQSLSSAPEGWHLKHEAPESHQLRLHIRLKEQNLERLAQRTLEVSDPDNALYGKHLTRNEIDDLTAPSKKHRDAVLQWLNDSDIPSSDIQSGFITINLSVAQAKKLLDADYGVYTQASTGRSAISALKYSVPASVDDAIVMIQPITLFSDLGVSKQPGGGLATHNTHTSSSPESTASICQSEGNTTISCLRENYNIAGYSPAAGRTKFGVLGFLEEIPDLSDIQLQIEKYAPDVPSDASVTIESINGGITTGHGREANLDTQVTVPLTYPIENVFYSVGGRPPFNPIDGNTKNNNEPYLDWLKYTLAMDQPAQTYTISYGEDERSVPRDYMDAVCSQFLKLAARGVSVLVISGDTGAGTSYACDTNTTDVNTFFALFPASCPWVTTVGGTIHYGDDEEADHDGGGGFSNTFPQPEYQRQAVDKYVQDLNGKFSNFFNSSGRAYPDVTAAYHDYPVFLQGQEVLALGTSASTPVVASVFALLNDYRVSKGESPLGFLNPWLYKVGHRGFRDIAKGHINVCKKVEAFSAAPGWDAASGWGVPDFQELKKLV